MGTREAFEGEEDKIESNLLNENVSGRERGPLQKRWVGERSLLGRDGSAPGKADENGFHCILGAALQASCQTVYFQRKCKHKMEMQMAPECTNLAQNHLMRIYSSGFKFATCP